MAMDAGLQMLSIGSLWRVRSLLSYKNATIFVCALNLLTAILLIHSYASISNHRRSNMRSIDPELLRHMKESEEIRRAMEPMELIKRVREIEQEAYADPGVVELQKAPKQTTAVDLSKRLKDLRALNDPNSLRALEEWRKRKMDRARQREIEKNGTS